MLLFQAGLEPLIGREYDQEQGNDGEADGQCNVARMQTRNGPLVGGSAQIDLRPWQALRSWKVVNLGARAQCSQPSALWLSK